MKNSTKTPKTKAKKFVKKDTTGNPFLEMIIEGIENLEQEKWEHFLKDNLLADPTNMFTKKEYTRYNRLTLMIHMMLSDLKRPLYATFNQISSAGGKLKKGSKGVVIQYFNFDIKHKEKKIRISLKEYKALSNAEQENYIVRTFLKFFRVFNIEHIENIDEVDFDKTILDETDNLEDINLSDKAEDFITNLKSKKGLKLEHRETRSAYYSPSTDSITLPQTEYFKDEIRYYATLFHELIHWTGHPDRLKRFELSAGKRSEYAFEELVAEMGSMLMNFDFKFNSEFSNSLVYLKGWLKSTKEDKDRVETLSEAFKLSTKAVNYLNG